ncbi:MAG: ATP-binding cassette domain-containing protein [Asticcacaulis sp.]
MTQPMPSLPVAMYNFALSPYESWNKLAWAGALLVAVAVLASISSGAGWRAIAPTRNRKIVMTDTTTADFQSVIVPPPAESLVLNCKKVDFFYGKNQALFGVDLPVKKNAITALIGPSGCGKSTLLRIINRIYDLYPGQKAEGEILFEDMNIIGEKVDLVALRARIGMVFQKPTPFPMSIYDNVAFGVRLHSSKSKADMDQLVETSLRRAAPVGRSQGQAQQVGPVALRRPAATPVRGARHRRRPGNPAARRTGLGARPDLDRQAGRHAGRAEARLHHRHRHAQLAAGGASVELYGLHVPRQDDRIRPDRGPVRQAEGRQDGRIYRRQVRLIFCFRRGAGSAENAMAIVRGCGLTSSHTARAGRSRPACRRCASPGSSAHAGRVSARLRGR